MTKEELIFIFVFCKKKPGLSFSFLATDMKPFSRPGVNVIKLFFFVAGNEAK